MTPEDALGHGAYLVLMAGQFALARQWSVGWALRFAGEAGWVGIGLYMGMSSIWFWGLLFMAMDVYGWMNWRQRRLGEIE